MLRSGGKAVASGQAERAMRTIMVSYFQVSKSMLWPSRTRSGDGLHGPPAGNDAGNTVRQIFTMKKSNQN